MRLPTLPVFPKHASPIASVVQQWLQKPTGKSRVTPAQLDRLVKQKPESLEARLATSPYAKILASPPRHCQMLRRTFPSKLLIRFGVGYHPKTDRIWAFPTLEKPHELSGKGYYVKLRKDVLELFGTKGHYAAFKMGATYRTDMSQTIEKAIYQQALDLFRQRALWVPLKLVGHCQWQVVQEDDAQKGFQCIVIIKGLSEPSRQCCELNHKIGLGPSASSETPRILQNVPCYDSQQFWSEAERDEICKELNITGDTAVIGIPKHIKTVELAVALWRIGLYKS